MSGEAATVPAHRDVVVIGGGVVGLAVAHALVGRGAGVLVLDRGDVVGAASRAAAGMLAPTSEADLTDRAMVDLELDSLRRYPGFVAEVERASGHACGYRDDGTLWLALTRDQEGDLERLAAMQRAKGLAARRLTAAEALDREPRVSGRIVSALLVEGDHQVDPRALTRALRAAVITAGGLVVDGARVTAIDHAGGRVRGVAGTAGDRRFDVACETVVLAAGVWSGDVEGPLPSLGLRPVKGQILRLRGPAAIRHVVRTPEVYLVPRHDGTLLVGATMEEQGLDPSPTAGAVLDLLREAWRVLPAVYDFAVEELSVGFRPAVRDHRPVIGETGTRGCFVATGHFRNGVLLAPATAHHLADWIRSGIAPAVLAPFGVERLAGAVTAGPVAAARR